MLAIYHLVTTLLFTFQHRIMDVPESFDWSICEFWQEVYESKSLQELLFKLNEYTTKSGSDMDYVEGYLSPYNLFLQNLEKEVKNYEKQIQIGYKNIQHFLYH